MDPFHMKEAGYWLRDYFHAFRKQSLSFLYRKPPTHYLGYIQEHKAPIVLIPGIYEKWHFLKAIADPLSQLGHPIYVVEHLGYNMHSIPESARLINEFLEEKRLRNVIIIAHSKGGLIGKYLLIHNNSDNQVKKLIAIASPFGGSGIARYVPHKPAKELHPEAEELRRLKSNSEVNFRIISICGTYDNHLWPESSCHLDGATNIEIDTYGHHRILANKEVLKHIMEAVENSK